VIGLIFESLFNIGCKIIPSNYVGTYSGTLSQQRIEFEVKGEEMALQVNGKRQVFHSIVSDFESIADKLGEEMAGAYLFPSLRFDSWKELLTPHPWIQRSSPTSYCTNPLKNHTKCEESTRYLDFYAVVPYDKDGTPPFELIGGYPEIPRPGGEEDSHTFVSLAFVVYAQLDQQSEGDVKSINVQIAPQAKIHIYNGSQFSFFQIVPEPKLSPMIIEGKLTR